MINSEQTLVYSLQSPMALSLDRMNDMLNLISVTIQNVLNYRH
jgi:hypothetical protein